MSEQNSLSTFILGMLAGTWKFLFINVDAAMLIRIAEATVTATICGFAAMAAKDLYLFIKRKLKKSQIK
jgi:hypothetical protein